MFVARLKFALRNAVRATTRLKSTAKRLIRSAIDFAKGRKEFIADESLVGESPYFDEMFYRRTYPGVVLSGEQALRHYMTKGWKKGLRPSAKFDGDGYLDLYPDVEAAQINPLVHYLRFGKAEGRFALPPFGYLRKLHPVTERSRFRSLVLDSGLFDREFYLRTYPDINPQSVDPLDHYIDYGYREWRRTHPDFDARWYADNYPDVMESGLPPIIHFLLVGKAVGRLGNPGPGIWSSVRRMIASAGEIEPSILLEPSFSNPTTLQVFHTFQSSPIKDAWKNLLRHFSVRSTS
jgi:hypothetical protein